MEKRNDQEPQRSKGIDGADIGQRIDLEALFVENREFVLDLCRRLVNEAKAQFEGLMGDQVLKGTFGGQAYVMSNGRGGSQVATKIRSDLHDDAIGILLYAEGGTTFHADIGPDPDEKKP